MSNDINMKRMIDEIATSATAMLDGVTTVADTKGISYEELEAIYKIGFTYYSTGKLAEAEKVFYALCVLSHTSSKYWTALGAVRQANKNYGDAIKAYAAASIYDLHLPKPHYYAAECNFALGDYEAAESGVLSLMEYCPAGVGDNNKYREKAQTLLKLVKAAQDSKAEKA